MPEPGRQPFSLVRLSLLAIAVFLVSAVAVVLALGGVRSSSNEAITAWRSFADQASAEQRVFRNYVTLGGMAGFIDDYGRLVAEGDQAEAGLIYARGGAALLSINAFPLSDASEEVKEAHARLQANLTAHIARIQPILEMRRQGRPAAEIAAAARVDDTGLADALAVLSQSVDAAAMGEATLLKPKALVLLAVRRDLGIGGLVHHANAYLAGGTDVDRKKAEASIEAVTRSLSDYRIHKLEPEEAEALDALERALAGAGQQIATGASAFLDTADIQSSLLEIESFVYAEATRAQNNLQATLTEISGQAGGIIILVGVGAVLLLAGSVWLLVFRIGRRVRALTDTMHQLASGKLDVEIPASSDRDEIGQMSRALLVFRDGLRANASLTTELAESSRLASLGAMVAGMAHELNTPLGNALAVSSTLEEQSKRFRKDLESDRIFRSMLERHASSLEDAATLIQRNLVRAADQIGSFKQVAVDQTSGKRRQFHLDDVLGNVVQSLTPLFKRTPFTLTFGETSGAVMDSYPGALSQVITNLVENALRHGLADRLAGRVEVNVRRLGPHVTEISVCDNGSGIPESVMPNIFNAFFTTKEGKGGSGLGLHIVKSIVCGPLGGQISVQSKDGQGSRFIITLPNQAPAGSGEASMKERSYYAAAQQVA